MTLGLIWAQDEAGTIGMRGSMPWHLPEDMSHFRKVTTGSTVIMGRKTWESLPSAARPLKGRRNVVITRQQSWTAEGAIVVSSVDEAMADSIEGVSWVIGGGQIYSATIERAQLLEVTEVRGVFAGDTVAPRIDARWVPIEIEPDDGWLASRSGLEYRFTRFERLPTSMPTDGDDSVR